jgi:hypothetical protein
MGQLLKYGWCLCASGVYHLLHIFLVYTKVSKVLGINIFLPYFFKTLLYDCWMIMKCIICS